MKFLHREIDYGYIKGARVNATPEYTFFVIHALDVPTFCPLYCNSVVEVRVYFKMGYRAQILLKVG